MAKSKLAEEKGKMMEAERKVQSGNLSMAPINGAVAAENNMKRKNFPMRNEVPAKNGQGIM